jgi:uncharacterized membrane protein YkvA (DUF1232 family)
MFVAKGTRHTSGSEHSSRLTTASRSEPAAIRVTVVSVLCSHRYDQRRELKMMSVAHRLRGWASAVKRDGVTLWFATRHPRVPLIAKALGVFVVAYALSPIDLIPDFVPVLGYVDDVILLPGLIWLAIKLIPASTLAECRTQADDWIRTQGRKPTSRVGALLIIAIWIGVTWALWRWVIKPWLDA